MQLDDTHGFHRRASFCMLKHFFFPIISKPLQKRSALSVFQLVLVVLVPSKLTRTSPRRSLPSHTTLTSDSFPLVLTLYINHLACTCPLFLILFSLTKIHMRLGPSCKALRFSLPCFFMPCHNNEESHCEALY